MEHLSDRERELVAIGAALGSNCLPCVVFHIRQCRKSGITDAEVREAIEVAEQVKMMPAQLVRETAYAQLEDPGAPRESANCCNGPSDGEPPSCCD